MPATSNTNIPKDNLHNLLYIFSSKWQVKNFYLCTDHPIKPKAITISEFLSFCLEPSEKKKIPKCIHRLLLLQSLYNYKNIRGLLVFDESFLAYLEASDFLDKFFEELNSACVSIKNIPIQDTYGDFDDHIDILLKIYEHYETLMNSLNLCYNPPLDKPLINSNFIRQYKGIRFYLNGVLTKMEQNILMEIVKQRDVEIVFSTDIYNLDFFSFLNLELKANQEYRVKLSTPNKIISATPISFNTRIYAYHFNLRIDQVSLALSKSQDWLNNNIQRVALILPDQNLSYFLRVLGKNFNFTMGVSIKSHPYYLQIKDKLKKPINDLDDLQKICTDCMNCHPNSEIQHFNEVFFLSVSKLNKNQINRNFSLSDFYLDELKTLFLKEGLGGKIPVYGLLQTRGMNFDEIVILDFNEESLFEFKDDDIFLNTSIRKKLGMPTLQDKKNLRKHYYYELIRNTKRVYISLLKTDRPQYFLQSLEVEPMSFNKSIFHFNKIYKYKEDRLQGYLQKDFPLSSTSIKVFEQCKRKFYLLYIKKIKIKDQTIYTQLGSIIHEILFKTYTQTDIHNIKKIKETFYKNMKAIDREISKLGKLQKDLLQHKMYKFWKWEEERFKNGWRFFEGERDFEIQYDRAKILGKIDRIDINDRKYCIIDYKTGNQDNKNQLTIYEWAMRSRGLEITQAGALKLDNGEFLVEEEEYSQRLSSLKIRIEDMLKNNEYPKTQKEEECFTCQFTDLCNRRKN